MTVITPPVFRIAVTGHRLLSHSDKLSDSIRLVLDRIIQEHLDTNFYLFCALAEGGDQLVAKTALSYQGIKLIALLPVPEEEYLMGFTSDIGREYFRELIQSAEEVVTLPDQVDQPTAYEALGDYLLDHCEVLLALWNGQYSLKKGGTGEVVKKALDKRKIIYWIYADNGSELGEVQGGLHKDPGDIEILG